MEVTGLKVVLAVHSFRSHPLPSQLPLPRPPPSSENFHGPVGRVGAAQTLFLREAPRKAEPATNSRPPHGTRGTQRGLPVSYFPAAASVSPAVPSQQISKGFLDCHENKRRRTECRSLGDRRASRPAPPSLGVTCVSDSNEEDPERILANNRLQTP